MLLRKRLYKLIGYYPHCSDSAGRPCESIMKQTKQEIAASAHEQKLAKVETSQLVGTQLNLQTQHIPQSCETLRTLVLHLASDSRTVCTSLSLYIYMLYGS